MTLQGSYLKGVKDLFPGKQWKGLPIKLLTGCFYYSSSFGNCQIF